MANVKSNYLPGDIVTDILLRLPVKSLMRFRSVCKRWYGLFRNQDFVAKHHHYRTLNGNTNVIVRHDTAVGEYCLSVLCSGGDEVVTVVDTICPPFIHFFSATPHIMGPVNGLFLLYDMYLIILYNPATREFKIIPYPMVKTLPGSVAARPSNVGFGFDKKTNDYKIIRFFHNDLSVGVDVEDEPAKEQVALYSLKTDSWRELPPIDAAGMEELCNPYVDGVFHWLAISRVIPFPAVVIYFDFVDEVFEKLFLPFEHSSIRFELSDLAIMNVLPYIFNDNCRQTNEGVETWVSIWTIIKHGGVDESWKKIEGIGPIRGNVTPLRFWKSYLICDDRKGQLVLYDCSNKQVYNIFQLHGGTLKVLSYVESLVPIKGRSE